MTTTIMERVAQVSTVTVITVVTQLITIILVPIVEERKEDLVVVQQLVDMGFSERQAEVAVREIEYADVNLAAEWLFAHPEADQTMEVERQGVELSKMDKDEFQRQALISLNTMGKMFVFQLYELNTGQLSEFVLGLLTF